MARPRKKINRKQFESLCAIQCTQAEICSVLDVCEDTLLKWCKETYKMSFSEIYKQKRELGCMSLRRKQMELALSGNATMQIFLKEMELREREFALKEKSIELEQSRIEKLTNNPFKDLTIEQLMELARIDDEK